MTRTENCSATHLHNNNTNTHPPSTPCKCHQILSLAVAVDYTPVAVSLRTRKESWNLHVDHLGLWLWLIARLTTALVGLLRWLGVVPTLTGGRTCEETLINYIADIRIVQENPHPEEDNIALT